MTSSHLVSTGVGQEAPPSPGLTEHPAPKRLVAQRGLFRGPAPEIPEELYADVVAGRADTERRRLVVGQRSTVSTNTYFGRFPASYWQRWTLVTQVDVETRVSGTGRLLLRASDTNGVPRTVAVHEVAGAEGEAVRLSAALDRFVDGGGLWLEVATGRAELALEDVRWTVEPPERLRPTAVVICTHNRADDCVATLEALVSERDALDVVNAVYVVDQGTDPVESRPGFARITEVLGDQLRYIRQPNLGGSGGFTRGLYEVNEVNQAEHANVLFMDDDVRCEPEVLIRLTAFANLTSHPAILGAQMLNLLHPTHVLAGAEYAVPEDLTNGLVSPDAVGESDVTGRFPDGTRNVQDRRVDAGYTGWWSCLIPSEIVNDIGYPLPLFFQWDDVEYCYRARGRGYATVTLPGAGLWHADFPWKDWDDWHRYFNLRNAMITAALHTDFPVRHIAGQLGTLFGRYLVSMNYGLAATLLKAIDDFLAGPDVLEDGGVAAVAEVRAMRTLYSETLRHPAAQAPGMLPVEMPVVRPAPTPRRKLVVLAKRVVQQALGRTLHRAGLVPAGDGHWWHVSLFDRVAVTDASQAGVRVRERDPEKLRRLAREGSRVLWRFIREAPAAVQLWREALPRLVSRENWARLYEFEHASRG